MSCKEYIRLTSISIAREVPAPFDERATLKIAARDRVAADGTQHAGVGEFRRGCDDRVRDVVVDGLLISSATQDSLYPPWSSTVVV